MKKLFIYFLLIISSLSLIHAMESSAELMQKDEETVFKKLPRELIESIFMLTVCHQTDIGKLVKDLLLIGQTNKEWHEIIKNDSFWNSIFQDFFRKVVLCHAIDTQDENLQNTIKIAKELKNPKLWYLGVINFLVKQLMFHGMI